jgi:DNA polymerase elongation subunit (family B)
MKKSRLEKLYQERTLIKKLISMDRERYSFLNSRSNEIKTIINSEYAPIPNSEYQFALFQLSIADEISRNGRDILNELLKKEW